MVDIHDDPLELVPSRYDEWRAAFEAERDRIRRGLADTGLVESVVRIEHVGSTAVPGLAAKDIVDLDVVVADDAVADVSRALEDELGGTRMENSDTWQPVFRRSISGQRFNDHVFAVSGDRWKISVATRAGLLRYDGLRQEYESLKRELVAETDDLTEYSVGKTELVGRILDRVRADDLVDLGFEVPTDVGPDEDVESDEDGELGKAVESDAAAGSDEDVGPDETA